jgi:glycosyltransferase involved in cell wall biosynthesis
LTVRAEADAGMYDAINRGWSTARGDVLSWLNADEQYLPGALQAAAAVFEERDEVEVVFGDVIIVDDEGQPLAARREIPLRAAYVRNGFLYSLSCALFFRRSLLERGELRFDPTLRLAGDMDLVLRLLAAGVRVAHVSRYLALFGVSGRNLSAGHAQDWAREIGEVRRRSGAWRWPALRRLVLLGRHLERWARGCYVWRELSYDFATDETPVYRHVSAARVTPFFTYERAAVRAAGGVP